MRAVYLGHEVLTFNDYLDVETGRTLTAEPGGTYDVAPAGGSRPDVPPGWFAPEAPPEPVVVSASVSMAGSGEAAAPDEPEPEDPERVQPGE